MGGFTQCFLKDKTQKNIDLHNEKLRTSKVARKYRFYSENDTIYQYECYLSGKGVFSEYDFPKSEIHSYIDFKKYWSTEVLGDVFVPPYGTLQFDCYFGRMSENAMRKMGKYIAENITSFENFDGSFETFMERGMSKKEIKIVQSQIKL
jgi:hypothetical protein